MGFVYLFWGMVALSAAGVIADVLALRRHTGRRLALVALVLKTAVLIAALAWAVYFRVLGLTAGDWGDLTLFATIIVAGAVLLTAAVVCDIAVLVALRRKAA